MTATESCIAECVRRSKAITGIKAAYGSARWRGGSAFPYAMVLSCEPSDVGDFSPLTGDSFDVVIAVVFRPSALTVDEALMREATEMRDAYVEGMVGESTYGFFVVPNSEMRTRLDQLAPEGDRANVAGPALGFLVAVDALAYG